MSDRLRLAGLHVLVVEDDELTASLIEEWLVERRCDVLGPCSQLHTALEVATTSEVDIGLLKLALGDDKTYQVADVLEARGIPFLFLSNVGEEVVLEHRPEWRVCVKPFRFHCLTRMMVDELALHDSRDRRKR